MKIQTISWDDTRKSSAQVFLEATFPWTCHTRVLHPNGTSRLVWYASVGSPPLSCEGGWGSLMHSQSHCVGDVISPSVLSLKHFHGNFKHNGMLLGSPETVSLRQCTMTVKTSQMTPDFSCSVGLVLSQDRNPSKAMEHCKINSFQHEDRCQDSQWCKWPTPHN